MTVFSTNSSTRRIRTGCDLVQLSEIESSLAMFGQRYLDKLFTAGEQADAVGPTRLQRLAARFAAKEATIKAFAAPEAAFAPLDMEVVLVGHVPTLRLHGAAQRLAAVQQWMDASLSMSHTDCHAAAVLFVMCGDAGAAD